MRGEVTSVWAKRFMSQASSVSFEQALHRENYWTVEVFDLMVERCDELIFLDPSEGLKCSRLVASFAGRVRGLDSERKALAMAVEGSAFRANRLYGDARFAYELALKVAKSKSVIGRVRQRIGVLNLAEGNLEGAFEEVDKSVELLSGHFLGVSLTLRGSLFAISGDPARSAEEHSKALILLDTGSHSYFCALRNLGDSLFALSDVEAIAEVLALLRKARFVVKDLSRGNRKAPLAFLDWLEGRINGKLGSHRRAAAQLLKAKQAFFSLGGDYIRDVLLIGVDLAIVLDASGEFEEAAVEARSLIGLAEVAGCSPELEVIRLFLCASSGSDGDLAFTELRTKLQS